MQSAYQEIYLSSVSYTSIDNFILMLSCRPLYVSNCRRALEPEARVPSALVPAGAADQHVGRVTTSSRTTQEHGVCASVGARGAWDVQTAEHWLKALGSPTVTILIITKIIITTAVQWFEWPWVRPSLSSVFPGNAHLFHPNCHPSHATSGSCSLCIWESYVDASVTRVCLSI
jgi:hypothetical protein